MFVAVYFFGDFSIWIAALAAAGMGIAETAAWTYVYNTVKRGEIEARREEEESAS